MKEGWEGPCYRLLSCHSLNSSNASNCRKIFDHGSIVTPAATAVAARHTIAFGD